RDRCRRLAEAGSKAPGCPPHSEGGCRRGRSTNERVGGSVPSGGESASAETPAHPAAGGEWEALRGRQEARLSRVGWLRGLYEATNHSSATRGAPSGRRTQDDSRGFRARRYPERMELADWRGWVQHRFHTLIVTVAAVAVLATAPTAAQAA